MGLGLPHDPQTAGRRRPCRAGGGGSAWAGRMRRDRPASSGTGTAGADARAPAVPHEAVRSPGHPAAGPGRVRPTGADDIAQHTRTGRYDGRLGQGPLSGRLPRRVRRPRDGHVAPSGCFRSLPVRRAESAGTPGNRTEDRTSVDVGGTRRVPGPHGAARRKDRPLGCAERAAPGNRRSAHGGVRGRGAVPGVPAGQSSLAGQPRRRAPMTAVCRAYRCMGSDGSAPVSLRMRSSR